ncbi:hypothetical protein BD560DRAFT_487740 [Blakeslea trispora]|nr:hypothetical protein BD560DRAFT_487740 [Blakeslea trispora]
MACKSLYSLFLFANGVSEFSDRLHMCMIKSGGTRYLSIGSKFHRLFLFLDMLLRDILKCKLPFCAILMLVPSSACLKVIIRDFLHHNALFVYDVNHYYLLVTFLCVYRTYLNWIGHLFYCKDCDINTSLTVSQQNEMEDEYTTQNHSLVSSLCHFNLTMKFSLFLVSIIKTHYSSKPSFLLVKNKVQGKLKVVHRKPLLVLPLCN